MQDTLYPMTGNVTPGGGRNLTYSLLDTIGRMIVTGGYDVSGFPTEAELAQQNGVSRSVTREAVKMLTAKGLLSARPRKGTVVEPEVSWNLFDPDVLRWLLDRKFSLALLHQFTELRMAIEPFAARLAASAADPAAIAQIQAGYDRLALADKGEGDTLSADIEFHLAVLRGSGNPFYAQFRDVVSTALQTSIRFTNRYKGRSASLPAHHAVLDAILKGEPERAEHTMYQIIVEVMDLIRMAEAEEA